MRSRCFEIFSFLLLVLVSVFFKQSLQLAEKMSSLNQKLRLIYIGDGSRAKTHATATATVIATVTVTATATATVIAAATVTETMTSTGTMTACSTSPGLPLQCHIMER